ncbi:MAG: hypothetical protein Q4E09_01510 [Eubacteriales bacterium]|nr:hypothetical protein [Eubacteriales bacterium]
MDRRYNLNSDQTKPRKKLLILVFSLILVLLIVAVGLVSSLFRAANSLMTREGKEANLIASHLMPRFDPVTFSPEGSDLRLKGWYFASKEDFRGNLILVHHQGLDKLEYGLDTLDLVNFFLDQGFNILLFDQRHSGESDGQNSSYGYSEYQDVIAAMGAMYAYSGHKDFLLYGIGSGTTSCLFTWEQLPEEITEEDRANASLNDPLLVREDITGFILDTPVASAYDYIRADLKQETFLQKNFYYRFVPDIVRISSGGPEIVNLIPLLGHIDVPLMVTRNLPETAIPQASVDAFINECGRLKAESSYLTEIGQAGHLNGYLLDKEKYLEDIAYFLNIWF